MTWPSISRARSPSSRILTSGETPCPRGSSTLVASMRHGSGGDIASPRHEAARAAAKCGEWAEEVEDVRDRALRRIGDFGRFSSVNRGDFGMFSSVIRLAESVISGKTGDVRGEVVGGIFSPASTSPGMLQFRTTKSRASSKESLPTSGM